MNKKIATAIAGILLIGIISASLLTHFAVITGSVEVKGPVFYLDGSNVPISPYTSDLVYRDLLVNNAPSVFIEDTYIFDGNRIIFITNPLEIDWFYKTEFNIKVWIKTNNQSNIAQYRIVRIKEDLSVSPICQPDEVITFDGNYGQFRKKEKSCQSDGIINLNPEDRIGLEISGAGGTSEYWIATGNTHHSGGPSKIEVSAI